YTYKYAREKVTDDPEWFGCEMNVNLCNAARLTSNTDSLDTSRLEQQYCIDMFHDVYKIFWYKKNEWETALDRKCSNCKGEGNVSYSRCPYMLAYVIEQCAKEMNVSVESVFDAILGTNKINFPGTSVKKITCEIDPEDIKGINSKSAHAAYVFLSTKAVSIRDITESEVQYTYLPLCRKEDRESFVPRYIDFWKTGSGNFGTVKLNDKYDLLEAKRDDCRSCGFEQCPDKLAAYFVTLARKYGCSAVDLAYYVAKNSTYAGITTNENWQFNKYLDHVRKSSMKEEGKAEFIKMIHYIVGRKKNWIIPFLPFNFVVTTPDRDIADDIISDFFNALWYFDYYKVGKDQTNQKRLYMSSLSFKDLLNEYYTAPSGLTFCLYDVELLCDNNEFKANYHKLIKLMEDKKEKNMTIICGSKESVNAFFASFPEFKKKIFTKELELLDIDKSTVFEKVENKLIATFEIPEEVRERLQRYINVAYPSSPLRSMEFVNDLYEKILFNHFNSDVNAGNVLEVKDLPYIKPPRSEAEIFEELNKLTGLENVKTQLKEVNDLVKFNMKTGKTGKGRVNLHMMFTGNAGTGKTTVARLTAEILHSIGFIQENKVVICSGKDLIGEYLGQTSPKTAKKCEEAYNGVLFIDEAYQLNPYTANRADTFKEECIAELIQQMENNRDKLVVIFAGYTDEMRDFLERANTGLKSRIGREIEFPDYSADELIEIFERIVASNGMKLEDAAKIKARDIIEEASLDKARFGNARFARSLYERSLMQHAAVTANLE
ncbi:MAG: AAA family ATPase, partial [Clostridia bacterium]|nr:AAA family ATPase [Clostridia bacterium]